MSPKEKKQRIGVSKGFFRKWHRRFGLAVSIFVLLLALTGIMLNHYQLFSLHKNKVQQLWLLDWYGIRSPENIVCTKINATLLCQAGKLLLLVKDEKPVIIEDNADRLITILGAQDRFYLVTSSRIVLYTMDFQRIENFEFFEETAETVISATIIDDHLLLKTVNQTLRFDPDSFQLTQTQDIGSSGQNQKAFLPEVVSDQELKRIVSDTFRRQQITWLKLVQDIHSGQILNIQGKIFNDLVGLVLILLGISGFITWQRTNRRSL